MSLGGVSGSSARPRWIARSGALAVASGCAFLLWVLLLQVMRGDLSWVQAQLSAYLHGPYGLSLRVAYCLLALSIAIQAVALQASLVPKARSVVVPGLFWLAALGLATVAIGDSYLPQYAPAAALSVHLVAAQAAFLCVISAILLQSWHFRADPHWRPHAAPAAWLGALAFVVLFVHAVLRLGPRGLGQKSAIALIVTWLVWAGLHLARDAQAAPSRRSRDNGIDLSSEER